MFSIEASIDEFAQLMTDHVVAEWLEAATIINSDCRDNRMTNDVTVLTADFLSRIELCIDFQQ